MARAMSVYTQNGTDYIINDPNNADEFVTSKAWAAGEICYHGGDLYVFTADHAINTAWSGTDVRKIKLGEEVSGLKSELRRSSDQLYNAVYLPFGELFQGTIQEDGTDGLISPQRVRSGFIKIDNDKPIGIKVNAGIIFATYIYTTDSTASFVLARGYGYFSDVIITTNDAKYIRLLFAKSDNSNILPSDIGLELTYPPAHISYEVQSTTYRDDIIGVLDSVVGAKMAGMNADGSAYSPAVTRAVTDIMPIDHKSIYKIDAYVNGNRAEALAIYYPNNTGAQSSRGTFTNDSFYLTPSSTDNYFRIMICKTNNAVFARNDEIKIYITRDAETIDENIRKVKDYSNNPDNRIRIIKMEQGAFTADGINSPGATRLRSSEFIPVSYLSSLKVTANASGNSLDYLFLAIFYSDNNYTLPQISRESAWTVTTGTIHILDPQVKYVRLYMRNSSSTTIIPSDVVVEAECRDSIIKSYTYYPTLSQMDYKACGFRKNGQDIAVYNGNIFDFGTGIVSINGGENISITNGHGNNCCFGDTKHGDYPYLYCAAWNKNEPYIYVNQYSNGAFDLVRTITYQGLDGYLNACIDENNNRAYILLNTSESTYDGVVDFIVGDLDGNIISRKSIDNIPVIEGMSFYNGIVIVSSGHGIEYPSYIHLFDTNGNLLSKTAKIDIPWDLTDWIDTIEGIDVDKISGDMYIGLTKLIVKNN